MPFIERQKPPVKKKKGDWQKKVKASLTRTSPQADGDVLSQDTPVEFDPKEGVNMIIYGDTGTGKTTLASTFPGPCVWFTCSGSVESGELISVGIEDRKKIKQYKIHSSDFLVALIERFKENPPILNGKPARTFVMDHVSGLEDLILMEVLGLDEIPVQKSWGLARLEDYGMVSIKVKRIMQELLVLKGHVLILAQEKRFTPEDEYRDGETVIAPSVRGWFAPGVAKFIQPAVDYNIQMLIRPQIKRITVTRRGKKEVEERNTGKFEHVARIGADDLYKTKFRVPRGTPLPRYVADPSYDKFMRLIEGKGKEDE